MTVWALIPVKPFAVAKSRLSSVLGAEQRAKLAEAMLCDTLATVRADERVAGICVVTSDPQAAFIAGRHGARVLDDTVGELNDALEAGRSWVKGQVRCAPLLVLPTDLPTFRPYDLDKLLKRLSSPRSVVIAAAHDGDGTNAILLGERAEMPFAFGPGSFFRHLAIAETKGLKVETLQLDGIARDLDRPEDIAPILARTSTGKAASLLLEAFGLARLSETMGAL
ncbi:2-phospho-L-lactate guanylyltransferase [Rhizobium sp. L1K21]|uniref:2-phospho-L-lactate guanylyltransferase n=1 Tax=Rhizobium sp. L1K21 TaxID=2954933 RepID=UPI002092B557|nr:2-phospho-L-lactate guanylyltransferase [Rhizobium sp. L1K21]MCO6187499.1 2-phospho-L-lactate guanylyltransferase [Rhizobium sp. L1K21]